MDIDVILKEYLLINGDSGYLFSLRSNSTPLECKCLNTPFSIDIPPLWGEEAFQNLVEMFKSCK